MNKSLYGENRKNQKKTRTLGISKFYEGLKRLIIDTNLGIFGKFIFYGINLDG
tara:strand:+ start:515 stop:673 length:159 start_codon:yes stop_codon:yes gene_type:complete